MTNKKIQNTDDSVLPDQSSFFNTEKLKKSTRAGTQLPDPTQIPFGYDAKSQFAHIFPKLNLPILLPPPKQHPDDYAGFGNPSSDPNNLYFGDNLYVLRNIPSESIDLIYIDPPFFSNRDYVQIWGDDNEVRSFNDIFGDGMFSYLAWLNARLWEMKRVLKKTGSIYVHCDWHASHYIKCEMDKIFGYENFVNEIVWHYQQGGKSNMHFARKHDSIYWYKKSISSSIFNGKNVALPLTPHKQSSTGKNYGGRMGIDENGREYVEKWGTGKKKLYRYYLDEGKIPEDVWSDIQSIQSGASERIGYPTQKPEALLERIIKASSNEGDVVADFFMGGGTTGAVALKLGRKFVGSDISRVAVSVTYNRLVEVSEELSGLQKKNVDESEKGLIAKDGVHKKLFTTESDKLVSDIRVGYVGSYPIDKFEGMTQQEFSSFILDLYEASPYTGQSENIHGLANGKIIIYVGPSSSKERVKSEDVKKCLEDVLSQYKKQLIERKEEKIIQVIGWSFEPGLIKWKADTVRVLNSKGIKLDIELVSLSNEVFRQKIFREIGQSNIDLKFNRLNQLLSFTSKPKAGEIVVKKQDGLKFNFELVGAEAIGSGARLINCQWDFDYEDNRFSDKKYALNREKIKSGEYVAVLGVEYEFDKYGEHLIAARIQDNIDGEETVVYKLEIKSNNFKIEKIK